MSHPDMTAVPEPSTARSWSLVLAALAAALLGLTLVDAAPLAPAPEPAAFEADSADCIVASAVFVGVGAAPPMR